MVEEMDALYSNGTWELVAHPPSKSPFGCRWVYTVKPAHKEPDAGDFCTGKELRLWRSWWSVHALK